MQHVFRQAAVAAAFAGAFSTPAAFAGADSPIVVTATRQAQRANELLADVSVIDRETIERSGQSTIAELLARQPGVQVVASGGHGANISVFIRGTNSSHTLVLVDGIRYGSVTSGQPAIENLPLDHVERIEILRGPASSLYGADAIGGVIQIFTRRGDGSPRFDAFSGIGSQRTATASAGISGGSGNWRYSLRGGTFVTAGFDALARPTDHDGFRQQNAAGSLALKLPNRGEVSLAFVASGGINRFDVGTNVDTRADKEATILSARWNQPLTERWTSTVNVGESTDDLATHDSGFDSVTTTRRRQITWQNDIRVGLGTVLLGSERVDDYVTSTGTALVSTERHTDSLFAGWTANLGEHRWQANLRRDRSDQNGARTTGGLAYGYQFTPNLRAHISGATGFKAPTFNDLYFPLMCFPPFGCFGGNPNLKPETARNREAGLDWDSGNHRAALVIFRNRIRDLIVWGNQPFNVGAATMRGATVSYERDSGDWKVGAALTLMRARDADTGLALIRRADRQFSAHADRRFGSWRVGGEAEFVGARDDTDFNTGNRVRLGGYGLLNAYAHCDLASAWRLEVRGNNLANKRFEPAFGFRNPGASVFVGVRYTPK